MRRRANPCICFGVSYIQCLEECCIYYFLLFLNQRVIATLYRYRCHSANWFPEEFQVVLVQTEILICIRIYWFSVSTGYFSMQTGILISPAANRNPFPSPDWNFNFILVEIKISFTVIYWLAGNSVSFKKGV